MEIKINCYFGVDYMHSRSSGAVITLFYLIVDAEIYSILVEHKNSIDIKSLDYIIVYRSLAKRNTAEKKQKIENKNFPSILIRTWYIVFPILNCE